MTPDPEHFPVLPCFRYTKGAAALLHSPDRGGSHGSWYSYVAGRRADPDHHSDHAVLALKPGRDRQPFEDLPVIPADIRFFQESEAGRAVIPGDGRCDTALPDHYISRIEMNAID